MSSWIGNSLKFGRNVNAGHEGPLQQYDPMDKLLKKAEFSAYPKPPPAPPPPPNPNDAANAARELTDSMRMRRGLLANIYAGGLSQQPVAGKTQLGA